MPHGVYELTVMFETDADDRGRSQGVQWAHLHPQGSEKIKHNLQGKFVSTSSVHQVHLPQTEQESILGHFLLGGGDLEVYLQSLEEGDD